MIKIFQFNKPFQRIFFRRFILGIETSCDDTGTAIINLKGNLISEHLESQINVSSAIGGIIPRVAFELHKVNIKPCVDRVMKLANISFENLSAIAVTVKPGLGFSLGVGRDYAVELAKKYNLPIIPIHHLEAHALTVRMLDDSVEFPFLVLLVSGGNSLISVVHNVEQFSLLGNKLDTSPGDCLDKIARMLHLVGNGGSHTGICGGRAIEMMAQENNKELLSIPYSRLKHKDCDFSFTGLESYIRNLVNEMTASNDTIDIPLICASVLHSISHQICRRVQRGMQYCRIYMDTVPNTLVVSGGVASNQFVRSCLQEICDDNEYRLICPPVKYCTDNGVMIAWNGYELFRLGRRIVTDLDTIEYRARAPFGVDIRDDLRKRYLILPRLSLKKIFCQ